MSGSLVVYQPGVDNGPCGACKALYGASCCEMKSGMGPRFPLTYGEASRLARHTGAPLSKAVDIKRVSASERESLAQSAGHAVADLIVDGVGLYLPLESQACRYLGPTGCTVPAVKPHICAMYPFAKGPSGWRLDVKSSGFCFGADNAKTSLHALDIFNMTSEGLESIHRRWVKDKARHKQAIRSIRVV